MTNIKLPDMSYRTLCRLADDRSPLGGWAKIAYQTYIRRDGMDIQVRHFDSIIATVSLTETIIDPCGYDTQATATRLNRIAYANTGMHVGLTGGKLYLRYDGINAARPLDGPTKLYNKERAA